MGPQEKKAFAKGFQAGADSVEEGLPGWFGTFADMMTLTVCFLCVARSYINHGSRQASRNGKFRRKIFR